jgi:caffeoyl-CoA O-methyltransferase
MSPEPGQSIFHNLPEPVRRRMAELEARDARDRADGTPTLKRLRQIPPEIGRFLGLLCAAAPPGAVLEVGTSAGYSSLWLTQACRLRGDTLTTFEVLPEKVALAGETFRLAQVEPLVELVHGDARALLAGYREVAFCFLDAEKDVYMDCYQQLVPRMVPGGLLAADNVLSHAVELRPFLEHVLNDPRVDALTVPIGKGIMVCRKA